MLNHTKLSLTLIGALFLTSCTKPSTEQLVEAIKKDPSLLANAIKNEPEKFKEALKVVGEMMQKERMREREEAAQKEQEKAFAAPLSPKLTAAQVYKGAENAKITIVEYTDFECPYCSRGADTMAELLKKYPGKVRVTVKHLPLPFHKLAMPSAQYFEAIRLQNPKAAVQFHDAVFANQEGLKKDGEKFLEEEAKKLGIKIPQLKKDIASDAVKKKIEADMEEARQFDIKGTPGFVVGGIPVKGALPPEEFAKIIDRLLKKG